MKKIIKWVVIGIAAFVLISLMAGGGNSKCPEQKVIEREVIKEVCSQELLWRELKEVDDRGFSTLGIALKLSAEGITAAFNHDVADLDKVTRLVNANNLVFNGITNERLSILSELGY